MGGGVGVGEVVYFGYELFFQQLVDCSVFLPR